jgi:4-hydroxy-tetrahydrodipicolinate synthase
MKLSGVMPALVTPFDANNRIDFKAFEKLLAHLREAGVTGWVPNGSTGEYFSQSNEERRNVLQFVKDFAKPGETLIAGTNAPATREVIEQTAMAKEIGYDSVLLAPPFYTRPTQAELIRHYETVLGAVDVNLVLYSYPAKDGSDISFELMDHFADNPRVIGIKESSGVLQRAIDIASRYEGRIQLVPARMTSRSTSCSGAQKAGSAARRTAWPRRAAISTERSNPAIWTRRVRR